VNPLFIPTLLLALVLFAVGQKISRRCNSPWFLIGSLLAAIPAVIFAAYYTKIFGEAKWLYSIRTLPFSELSAAGIGLIAGWLQFMREQNFRSKRMVSAFFIPFLMILCVAAPYLKQLFLRPDWSKFEDRWAGDVCLQSSESSCGPASAATLLRYFGKSATEQEIAKESFTTRRGTENWYLLRTIRKQGLPAICVVVSPGVENLLLPSIAGVRLNLAQETGHFIAILGKNGGKFIVGDPLNGREELTREELLERYTFTGFYLIKSDGDGPK
jgi:hypothetical protein